MIDLSATNPYYPLSTDQIYIYSLAINGHLLFITVYWRIFKSQWVNIYLICSQRIIRIGGRDQQEFRSIKELWTTICGSIKADHRESQSFHDWSKANLYDSEIPKSFFRNLRVNLVINDQRLLQRSVKSKYIQLADIEECLFNNLRVQISYKEYRSKSTDPLS